MVHHKWCTEITSPPVCHWTTTQDSREKRLLGLNVSKSHCGGWKRLLTVTSCYARSSASCRWSTSWRPDLQDSVCPPPQQRPLRMHRSTVAPPRDRAYLKTSQTMNPKSSAVSCMWGRRVLSGVQGNYWFYSHEIWLVFWSLYPPTPTPHQHHWSRVQLICRWTAPLDLRVARAVHNTFTQCEWTHYPLNMSYNYCFTPLLDIENKSTFHVDSCSFEI